MNKLKIWLNGMKILRSFYAILLVILGGYLADNLDVSIILKTFAIFCAWEYTAILNNIYDIKIDKLSKKENPLLCKLVSRETYLEIGIAFGIASIVFSYQFFPFSTLLILSSLMLGTIYSIPPLRLRRYPFSSCFIGAGTVISLILGMIPLELTTSRIITLLIIFLVVSIGTSIKDLESYEADKRLGINTIFTIWNKEKGKKVASLLLFSSFLIPLVIFPNYIIIFISAGIVSTILFYKREDIKIIIVLVMILFLLCASSLKASHF